MRTTGNGRHGASFRASTDNTCAGYASRRGSARVAGGRRTGCRVPARVRGRVADRGVRRWDTDRRGRRQGCRLRAWPDRQVARVRLRRSLDSRARSRRPPRRPREGGPSGRLLEGPDRGRRGALPAQAGGGRLSRSLAAWASSRLDRRRLGETHGGAGADGAHEALESGTDGRCRGSHITFGERRTRMRETEKIWMNGELV